jgi:hypothetical protein
VILPDPAGRIETHERGSPPANRDFVLLQAGQLLSAIGTASTTVAYPLLTWR